ncbi:TetR/AcrR family transcriptional regulator [Brevibacillus ruminantium]|uniref:TetR/AcrR family transcriptional regulator n=1 Tax=Brevibacillus ruminantium TaxID=2950604 RepID=A0ABY4W9B0_9BACL|nr:TetR/AcrR family transcriptional regulator [Brevibacillus ruminantium]USG63762.1 TetR/AcrR family transcriptional regulator [Brevibacillus ruminantium]
MTRRRLEGEKTKQHIAEKATELFALKGYAATSIEDICKAADASKGSLYYHFTNKEQLFLYLLEKNHQDWIEKWERYSAPHPTAVEKLYALADFFVDDFLSHPLKKAVEEFSGSKLADPEILQQVITLAQDFHRVYIPIFELGIRNGELEADDPDVLSYLLEGFLSGVCSTAYYDKPDQLHSVMRKSVDVFIKGIGKK